MTYNIEEFRNKVEWEGGLYEAVVGYGLDHTDLAADVDTEFVELVRQFAELAKQCSSLEDQITEYLDETE